MFIYQVMAKEFALVFSDGVNAEKHRKGCDRLAKEYLPKGGNFYSRGISVDWDKSTPTCLVLIVGFMETMSVYTMGIPFDGKNFALSVGEYEITPEMAFFFNEVRLAMLGVIHEEIIGETMPQAGFEDAPNDEPIKVDLAIAATRLASASLDEAVAWYHLEDDSCGDPECSHRCCKTGAPYMRNLSALFDAQIQVKAALASLGTIRLPLVPD